MTTFYVPFDAYTQEMSRKMSPHQQSPRLRQLQQQLGGAPPLRSRNGGSPRQNGGGARVGDVVQTPQVPTFIFISKTK